MKPIFDQKNTSVHALFESAAATYLHKVALVAGREIYTYQQLNEKADKLSKKILYSCDQEEIIAISSSRGVESVVALIAILKAGKAYLPLDFSQPIDRLSHYITDAKIKTCISPYSERKFFDSFNIKVLSVNEGLDEDMRLIVKPANPSLAYVLYTSGSTGRPKGVCMGDKAMVNLLQWQAKSSRADEKTKTLQFAPLIFDVSFQEIFSTLTTGGTLVLINEELHADPQQLLQFISEQQINRIFLPFVALQVLTDAASATHHFPSSLQEVITAGEQLKITPKIISFFTKLSGCSLINQYGPTESHVATAFTLSGGAETWPKLPPVGKAINNTQIFILDQNHLESSIGETGEIAISGLCLAEGYLNQPQLTEQKFIHLKNAVGEFTRVYLTGDLARLDANNDIEFIGRKDDQVKISGYRIELGEIEVLINQCENVRQAVVTANEDELGHKRLIAYVISADNEKNVASIKEKLEAQLPAYMMPSLFVWLAEFPKTASGKVDRKALPKPSSNRPNLTVLYKAAKTDVEKHIVQLWQKLLGYDKVGVDDNFFELGGSSLFAITTVASLSEHFNFTIPVARLYQLPTASQISFFIDGSINKKERFFTKTDISAKVDDDIAVIGMAVRFPGINNVNDLWEVLKEGKETTTFFSNNELSPFIPPKIKNDPDYVKARGIVDKTEEFDAAFFGINPKVAELMDPQQRLFLELAWEVLEQTGHLPEVYNGLTGVYAGSGNNTYYLHNVIANPNLVENVGNFQVMTLNEKDYIATRTAYELNLKGPAVSVHSACSSSLLAISHAVHGIRKGDCTIALAGASSIYAPVKSGHMYHEGGIMSKDGHCRPFDKDASGTVFSDGAGIVLLKSKTEAERDGDIIYGLIKGMGVNNDGADKGSFTAPNALGQAGAIAMAIENARVNPCDISYIETHGTATPIGDPIEIDGLNHAFGPQDKTQFCAIGSIKSNIGHLTAASGIAGFIKTVLSLHRKKIPATLFYKASNPDIDFDNSPFYVNTTYKDWTDKKRIAGVSSFGVGGTNVHAILEAYENKVITSGESRPFQLLTWSAKAEKSRTAYSPKLSDFLQQNKDVNLADVAYTLQTTRVGFNHRAFVVASSAHEIIADFSSEKFLSVENNLLREKPSDIVFLFPGQGAQYLNMGRELYDNEPEYRNAIDECANLLTPYLLCDIKQVIFPQTANEEAQKKLNNTLYTQPALFITEYALARLWISWGIAPTILCGHSIGELVAAQLAGIFSLEDALKLIASRSRMVSELPGGKMLSVRMEAERLEKILPSALSLAAINTSKACVVAGPESDIIAFSQLLDKSEISSKIIQTSHAFHSAMMDPVIEDFNKVVEGVTLNRPQKPIMSTVSGNWLTDAEATDPRYWSAHLRKTVCFANAIKNILKEDNIICIEVGPGNVTSALTRQQLEGKKVSVIASLENKNETSEYPSLLKALGRLWLQGVEPDWKSFYKNQQRQKLSLPTYAFNKKYCWVDPPKLPEVKFEQILEEFDKSEHSETIQSANINMRKKVLIEKIKQIIEDASGIEAGGDTDEISFLELGLDSLLLTQLAITLKKEFQLPITFRQLQEECDSIYSLATYLDSNLPAAAYAVKESTRNIIHEAKNNVFATEVNVPLVTDNQPSLEEINQQLLMLTNQIAALQNNQPFAKKEMPLILKEKLKNNGHLNSSGLSPEELTEIKKPFGATPKIDRRTLEFNSSQQSFLKNLIARYDRKTTGSKTYTQQNRLHMADPRVVSGFSPLTKEITYPIVVSKSKGSKLWDIDGNEYVDALNGFGTNLFGYQPEAIKKALLDQVDKGYELGPQHELCGEVSKMICEFTGFDRAAFCNTGSEAVLGALRIARTVTGRSLVVAFTGSYHGINDEVIVRGTKKLKSFPAASGIMPEAMQNMLILDYGTDESLQIIREKAGELAAVLVEPVQSRRPEFTPIEFLKQVRKITAKSGTALIFDEVITGFRMHPGGAQALFNISADIGTYGKVIGGGLPIGVIAGKQAFMDALDGGFWNYGDASFPETGVTYFAGTFVRHPLVLATAKASLLYMKEKGAGLQKSINNKAEYLSKNLNAAFSKRQLPMYVAQFGSLWKIKFKEEPPLYELIFALMREKGIHIWDGFPCFMTEAHSEEDVEKIIIACITSADEMILAGFFKNSNIDDNALHQNDNVTNAGSIYDQKPRLGRDKDGNPAWFVSDPKQPGKYLQLQTNY